MFLYEYIMNLGISKKLLLAFGFSSSAVLLAALVWWIGFVNAANNQQKIIQDTIPAMIKAQQLAAVTSRISTNINALNRAKIKKERSDLLNNLEGDKTELKVVLAQLTNSHSNARTVQSLESLGGKLLKNVKQQEELVNLRLELSRKRDVVSTELMNAAADLSRFLSAENPAGFENFINGNSPEWVEKNFWLRELGLSETDRSALKVETVKLVGIINQLTRETDLIVMNYLQSEFTINLNAIVSKVRRITKRSTRETAEEFLQLIIANSKTFNKDNVFEINRNLLRLDMSLIDLQDDNNDHVISVNSEVGRYIGQVHDHINSQMLQSENDMFLGRNISLVAIIVTIASVGLILWFYVVTAVRRLKVLEEGMTELAKGNYEIELDIDQHEHDELTLMADAVIAFREDAIEKQRFHEVQIETEASLRMRKDTLEKLVKERTKQILEVNRELAQQSIEHLRARELAESASKVKTDFLATMSHELRTPMSSLIGVINLIKDTELTAPQVDYLNTLEVISNTLLEILNDILGYSQIEAGNLIVTGADFNIHAVINDMITVLKPVADNKNIFLNADVDPLMPHILYGDVGKLRQILLNIMGNGLKFTNKGSVKLTVLRQPSSDDSNIWVVFKIEDTGIGIPHNLQENIFEAFHQGMVSIPAEYGGTGLGLSICTRLVSLLGGKITCSSTLGVGSIFSFELPFKQNLLSITPQNDDSLANQTGFQCTKILNVLVVEDDPTSRLVLRTYLEKAKHRVTEAENGETAVMLASNHDYDVILMDLRMPKINGVEAAKMIRKLPSQRSLVPIIAISAHVNPQKVDDFVGANMNAFIAKPVRPLILDETLYQVVSQQGQLAFSQSPVVHGAYPDGWDCYDLLKQDVEFIGIEKTKIKTGLFLHTSAQTLKVVNQAIANEDFVTVQDGMHKLKGSASAVGLYRLYELAGDLEALACDKSKDLPSHLEKLKSLYELSCDRLVKALEKVQSDADSD